VPSTWRAKVPAATSTAVATDTMQLSDAGVQAVERRTAGSQCEAPARAPPPATPASGAPPPPPGLATFLARVTPAMLATMAANAAAAAAAACVPSTSGRGDGGGGGRQEQAAVLSATLRAFSEPGGRQPNKHDLQVTAITWSRTGQRLAAAFGRCGACCCWQGWPQCLAGTPLGRDRIACCQSSAGAGGGRAPHTLPTRCAADTTSPAGAPCLVPWPPGTWREVAWLARHPTSCCPATPA